MSTQQKMRGGTTTQHAAFTGAIREVTVDTDRKVPVVHDAVRPGGWPSINFDGVQKQVYTAAVATGVGSNTIVIGLLIEPVSMNTFLSVKFRANATNTGSCTANVGLGAYTIKKMTPAGLANLIAGDLQTDGVYTITFNGTYWILEGGPGGLTTVKQADLSTATGTVSGTSSTMASSSNNISATSGAVTLPGGQYGFFFQSKDSALVGGSGGDSSFWVIANTSGSYVTAAAVVSLRCLTTNSSMLGQTLSAQQRYVTSSPPFDLGDGPAAGFLFALVDNSGAIKSHYMADVPPWGYNGKTDIRCKYICQHSGKRYRESYAPRTFEEIMDGVKPTLVLEEITQAVKNADMHDIPHPFGSFDEDLHLVMFNPMDERLARLLEYQNQGGADDVVQALMSGQIYADNICMDRKKAPPGVPVYGLKFKRTPAI